MNVRDWPLDQKVDWMAVRSRLNQQQFTLEILKPWARDPGFYVDRMMRITFADLPVSDQELETLQQRLRAVPVLVQEAMQNLDEVAADYADLALHNLSNSDGVGHGHPYRATPPAGVLGWYCGPGSSRCRSSTRVDARHQGCPRTPSPLSGTG